jgi:hypothetical protein
MIRTVHGAWTDLRGEIEEYGTKPGTIRWAGLTYLRATRSINGSSIFSKDWDLCVVLDACRADELARLKSEFELLTEVDTFDSLASCTWRWLPETIDKSNTALSDTAYISANPFTDEFCDGEFAHLDEVWRYAWSEDKGTVLPRDVTNRAISYARHNEWDRLLVHYLQPHVPFVNSDHFRASKQNFDLDRESPPDEWDRVTSGGLDRETAITGYRDNLMSVLESVETLLTNIDAETAVITADHGEAFGEYGIYGHPDVPLGCLTTVPWVETTATDERTHCPPSYDTVSRDESAVESHLEALGYT